MASKDNAVKIENFPLLKLRRPPNARQRRKIHLVDSICRAHAEGDGPMLFAHRKKVVDRFETARFNALASLVDGLLNLLLHAVNGLRHGPSHLHFFRDFFIRPIDASHVRKKVESKFRIVAEELGNPDSMFRRQAKRMLRAWAGVENNLHSRSRHSRFNCRFDLLHCFHQRITTGTGHTPLFDVGSRSCSPGSGTGNSPCALASR